MRIPPDTVSASIEAIDRCTGADGKRDSGAVGQVSAATGARSEGDQYAAGDLPPKDPCVPIIGNALISR